jgi:hypothetical protein
MFHVLTKILYMKINKNNIRKLRGEKQNYRTRIQGIVKYHVRHVSDTELEYLLTCICVCPCDD